MYVCVCVCILISFRQPAFQQFTKSFSKRPGHMVKALALGLFNKGGPGYLQLLSGIKRYCMLVGLHLNRRRENMVGVNMVLAEFIKFNRGLYKSWGVKCFEGIMLEPCLLQPCFHVAGLEGAGPGV